MFAVIRFTIGILVQLASEELDEILTYLEARYGEAADAAELARAA